MTIPTSDGLTRRTFLGVSAAAGLAIGASAHAEQISSAADVGECYGVWRTLRAALDAGEAGHVTHVGARLPYARRFEEDAVSQCAITALVYERVAPLAAALRLDALPRVTAVGGSSDEFGAPDYVMATLEYPGFSIVLATAHADYAGPMAIVQGGRATLRVFPRELHVLSPEGVLLRRIKASESGAFHMARLSQSAEIALRRIREAVAA